MGIDETGYIGCSRRHRRVAGLRFSGRFGCRYGACSWFGRLCRIGLSWLGGRCSGWFRGWPGGRFSWPNRRSSSRNRRSGGCCRHCGCWFVHFVKCVAHRLLLWKSTGCIKPEAAGFEPCLDEFSGNFVFPGRASWRKIECDFLVMFSFQPQV